MNLYRVAFILSDKRIGGFEKQVERIVNALNKDKNFECTIIYYSSSRSNYKTVQSEVFLNISSGLKIQRLFFMVKGLRNYLLSNPQDIVISGLHFNNLVMFISTIGIGVRKFISMRTSPNNYNWFFKIQHILLCHLVDGVIYNNKYSFEYFQRFCVRQNSHVIPNIYDFKSDKVLRNRNLKVFGVIGRNSREKNHSLVLNNWHLFSSKFRLIVKGPGYYNLIEGSTEYQDEFTDVSMFYEQLDCLIIPSLAEGFPNVVLEAWSRGVFVIISDSANSAGIVENGVNGFVFKNTELGFKQIIFKLLSSNSDEILKMRKSALNELDRKYRSNVAIDQLQKILL